MCLSFMCLFGTFFSEYLRDGTVEAVRPPKATLSWILVTLRCKILLTNRASGPDFGRILIAWAPAGLRPAGIDPKSLVAEWSRDFIMSTQGSPRRSFKLRGRISSILVFSKRPFPFQKPTEKGGAKPRALCPWVFGREAAVWSSQTFAPELK